jgi:disulfide bond formation protein DsbB
MLARLRPFWPLVTLAFSGAMWAVARFYFQDTLGLSPCPLCLDQRHWHWGVAGVSALAFVVTRFAPRLLRWAIVLIGLALLGSAAMGMYHVAVEQHWVVAQCDARIDPSDIGPIDWNASYEVPKCDEVLWSWLGVSMAGWNAIASLAMALLSFAVAAAPEKKP